MKTQGYNKGKRPQFGIKKTKLTLEERRKSLQKLKGKHIVLIADN